MTSCGHPSWNRSVYWIDFGEMLLSLSGNVTIMILAVLYVLFFTLCRQHVYKLQLGAFISLPVTSIIVKESLCPELSALNSYFCADFGQILLVQYCYVWLIVLSFACIMLQITCLAEKITITGLECKWKPLSGRVRQKLWSCCDGRERKWICQPYCARTVVTCSVFVLSENKYR